MKLIALDLDGTLLNSDKVVSSGILPRFRLRLSRDM